MPDIDTAVSEAPPQPRTRKAKLIRHAVTVLAVGVQLFVLGAGCVLSVTMEEFGCARSDPGFVSHGNDPVHDLTNFVFWVLALGLIGAALTRRWFVVAGEVVLICAFAAYLATHPNVPNWCQVS